MYIVILLNYAGIKHSSNKMNLCEQFLTKFEIFKKTNKHACYFIIHKKLTENMGRLLPESNFNGDWWLSLASFSFKQVLEEKMSHWFKVKVKLT